MKTIVFAVALLAASPAFADHESHRRDTRWSDCRRDYVEAYDGQCLEAIHPGIREEREIRRYLRRDRFDAEARSRECWSNPRIINPVRCSNGFPPVYSD
jgi:hypothetical protein